MPCIQHCYTSYLEHFIVEHRVDCCWRIYPLSSQSAVSDECDVVFNTEVDEMMVDGKGVTAGLKHCRLYFGQLQQLLHLHQVEVADT